MNTLISEKLAEYVSQQIALHRARLVIGKDIDVENLVCNYTSKHQLYILNIFDLCLFKINEICRMNLLLKKNRRNNKLERKNK